MIVIQKPPDQNKLPLDSVFQSFRYSRHNSCEIHCISIIMEAIQTPTNKLRYF